MKYIPLTAPLILGFSLFSQHAFAASYDGLLQANQAATCVTGAMNVDGGQYWSTVHLKITNQCAAPIDLRNADIKFNESHVLGGSGSVNPVFNQLSWPTLTLLQQGKVATVHVTFNKGSWVKSTLAASASVSLSYGVAGSDADARFIEVDLAKNPPQSNGTLILKNTTAAPQAQAALPTAKIYDEDTKKVVSTVQIPWNGQQQAQLQPAHYQIRLQELTIAGNHYVGQAQPDEVVVKKGGMITSSLTYKKQPVQSGSLNIVVAKKPLELNSSSAIPEVTLTDTTTHTSLPAMHPAWDKTQLVSQLVSGDTYQFAASDINIPQYHCVATFQPAQIQALAGNKLLATNLTYHCDKVATASLALYVNGLPSSQKSVDVELSSTSGVKKVTVPLANGQGNVVAGNFPVASRLSVASTQVANYGATYAPNPLTIKSGSNQEKITYQKQTGGNKLIVGYLQNDWGVPIKISAASALGYNVVVIAFAKPDIPDQPTTPADQTPAWQFGDNQFTAYTHWDPMSQKYADMIKADIVQAKQHGLKYVLVSVGGQNGTVSLAGKNLDNMAKNVRSFLNYYGLDGIDFDLEHSISASGLDKLIKLIKQEPLANGHTAIVTAAPQLFSLGAAKSPVNPYEVTLVTTGASTDYKTAVEAGDFDYLFVQAYNTGGTQNKINYNNVDYDETMPGYIQAAYYYLLGKTSAKQQYIHIPANTKLVIGEPTDGSAAGAASVYHNPNFSGDRVYSAMQKSYAALLNQAQFAGAMTWTINLDVANKCKFIDAIAPTLTGKPAGACSAAQ